MLKSPYHKLHLWWDKQGKIYFAFKLFIALISLSRGLHNLTLMFIVIFQEIMMDHSLRSISYIADIGDLLVIMARRRLVPNEGEDPMQVIAATPKMICHVFESEEVRELHP